MLKLYKPQRLPRLIFVISLIAGVITTLNAQAWYNSDWGYRRPVTIENPGGTELTDYQVKISLDNTFNFANAKSDGSDILVTASDGITLIPFWIEDWNPSGTQATIWVKVSTLPILGLTVYLYYGNPSPVIPPLDPVETPPAGPFTKNPSNPIIPINVPVGRTSLLAENIVYDDVTQHYWMVLTDQTSGATVCLVYSDDPTNSAAWYWGGVVIPQAIAPHIMKHNGSWYIFYGDRAHGGPPYPIAVASSPNVNGPYSYIGPVLQAGAPGSWEDYRVDEPCVFQSSSDGKWIMLYMADSGGNVEQVGYAESDNLLGPYTKYAGNPCIPFGPLGSYDAGTVADPWIYEYQGVYYIGYTVSPTTSSPWQTALATTSDWQTFTKHGIILPRGIEFNSFRGAVIRIGDEYVFSYTGGPASGQYRLCIATQPVFMFPPNVVNDGNAVFNFFDGFDGSTLTLAKWSFASGNISQTVVSGGFLTMTASATYVRINGSNIFGMDYIGETRARHPNQGVNNMIGEVGFADVNWNTVRIVDDFPSITHWQRQAKLTGQPDVFVDMQTADQNWHIFHVYRQSPGTAGFQIDGNPVETVSSNVPTMDLPPFLMSYGNTNQFIVDWTRVRKWAGADATSTVGEETPFMFKNVYLSSGTSAEAGNFYPNVNWGMPNPFPPGYPGTPTNDWDFTAPIELYIVPEVGSVFGASDITIKWDNTMYNYVGVENSGIFVGADFQSNYSTNGNTDQVIINAARTDDNNFNIIAGQYIAKLNLNLLKPGYGPVSITDLDFRAFNGIGGEHNVYVTGNNAQVKSYLGDVASTTPASLATGDGLLNIDDLTLWSVSYWSGVPPAGMGNYKVKYDVGPTSTSNVYGIPAVDGKIQFEDFVIFAMSYGLSANNVYPKIESEPTAPVDLRLGEPIIAGSQTRIPLLVSGGVQNVRAMSLTFAGQFGRLVSVEKGTLLTDFTNPVIVMNNVEGNQVYVDLAVFGAEEVGINTEGEVLTLVFEGNTEINLNTADIRNILNNPMAVNISGSEGLVPAEFALMQNYPNPFNPTTTINYNLPKQAMVEISIYNALGEKVATLVNEIKEAGKHTVEFNAVGYSSGIYFFQIKANDLSTGSGQSFVSVKKMILMK